MDVVIFGNNDFARLIKYYLETDGNKKVLGFTVDKKEIKTDTFCGLPVVPFEEVESIFKPEKVEIILAIGYSKMNTIRTMKYNECKGKGYQIGNFIHSSCLVNENVEIGEGNIFLERCLIQPFVNIGNCNLFWDHVVVSHDCTIGDFNTLAGSTGLCGYVTITNNVFLGKHCVVNDHSNISSFTLVGSNAVVKKDTKPYSVIVPAKSIVLSDKNSMDLI